MSEKGWKKAERMFAGDVGTDRIPVTGERHGSDFAAGLFAYQLKIRKVLWTDLFRWLAGIVGKARDRGQIGVLVVNLPRQPRRHALVILRWEDWVALHGAPCVATDPGELPDDTGSGEPEEGQS